MTGKIVQKNGWILLGLSVSDSELSGSLCNRSLRDKFFFCNCIKWLAGNIERLRSFQILIRGGPLRDCSWSLSEPSPGICTSNMVLIVPYDLRERAKRTAEKNPHRILNRSVPLRDFNHPLKDFIRGICSCTILPMLFVLITSNIISIEQEK